MDIGIFSGSFNPIHVGHLALANYLCEFGGLDELWFLVTPRNPFKVGQDLLPDALRLELVQLAVEGYSKFRASDFEFHLSHGAGATCRRGIFQVSCFRFRISFVSTFLYHPYVRPPEGSLSATHISPDYRIGQLVFLLPLVSVRTPAGRESHFDLSPFRLSRRRVFSASSRASGRFACTRNQLYLYPRVYRGREGCTLFSPSSRVRTADAEVSFRLRLLALIMLPKNK